MNWISFSSCCDEKMEICDTNSSEQEKDDCCEDSSCHCPCCHLTNFFSEQEVNSKISQTFFFESSYTYEFNYTMDLYGSLFRPPLV